MSGYVNSNAFSTHQFVYQLLRIYLNEAKMVVFQAMQQLELEICTF